jgi:hypothetical protein
MKIIEERNKIIVEGNVRNKLETQEIVSCIERNKSHSFIELYLKDSLAVLSDLLIYLVRVKDKDLHITLHVGNEKLFQFLRNSKLADGIQVRKIVNHS